MLTVVELIALVVIFTIAVVAMAYLLMAAGVFAYIAISYLIELASFIGLIGYMLARKGIKHVTKRLGLRHFK